jgi:2-hydroxymuconate-semialdehyde hydrolase
MDDATVLDDLRKYVAETVLEGHDVGLDAQTPLLDHGVLNSMEIMRLVAHIEQKFHVRVPMRLILADNFRTLESIANLIGTLQQGSKSRAAESGR